MSILVFSARLAGAVPNGFDERFRVISAEVVPALQVRRVVPLSAFYDQLRSFWRYLAWGLGLVMMSVILLSAAGIYALMSFTVAQRAREIAIRAALGAGPRRLLLGIFGRAARQLGLGLIAGSMLSALVFMNTDFSRSHATAPCLPRGDHAGRLSWRAQRAAACGFRQTRRSRRRSEQRQRPSPLPEQKLSVFQRVSDRSIDRFIDRSNSLYVEHVDVRKHIDLVVVVVPSSAAVVSKRNPGERPDRQRHGNRGPV
jgi:hypothetical protein